LGALPELREALMHEVELGLAQLEVTAGVRAEEPEGEMLAAHGLQSASTRFAVTRAALRDVVQPLLSALFAPVHFERRHCAELGVVATTA
jgi:hypothetical protein